MRQLVTESLVLSALGAAAGVAVAYGGARALLPMLDAGPVSIHMDFSPNGRILLFLCAMAAATGVAFGVLPALRASRIDPSSSLQGAGRGGSVSRQRLSRLLVGAQIAVSLLLLVVAGLLVESFRNLHRIEWGFRPAQVVVFELQHNPRDRTPARLAAVAADVQRRVGGLPGVESASVSWILLFSSTDQRNALQIPGYSPPPEESARFAFIGENIVMVRYNPVSPTYFNTVGMTMVSGRGLEEQDGPGAPSVAVINEAMARKYFPSGTAVGQSFVHATNPSRSPIRVVGIVRDAKFNNLREDVMPMYYAPILQAPRELRGLEVRTRAPIGPLTGAIRAAIDDVTKDIMIRRVVSLSEQVDRTLTPERLMMRLASFFGLVALLLSSVGLYGVLAYQVTQRTGEIGIRLALGATSAEIVRLVLRDTAGVVIAGVAAGLALAIGVTRILTSFLYGLTPTDPATTALAAAVLISATALAAYLPSRRAARVEPTIALRYQ
jgi:predicted permease